LTLHGSDLLVRRDYLDCKLQNATFCVTISQFNRDSILGRYPAIQASKIRIHRLGVDSEFWHPLAGSANSKFTMVSVGRLHAVKNYGFLIRACHILKLSGLPVRCVIAGDGEERQCLEQLVVGMELQHEVEFLGRVPRGHLPELYAQADVVVFTSLSEGVPLAAIEAMAMGRLVLAPAITGFPELITDGKTGLLYRAQSMAHFIAKLEEIRSNTERNRSIGRAARAQVREKFDQAHHLELFTTDFLQLVGSAGKECPLASANPVLQQI
jgi:glycosyltransferase involved in cell wall biosynthesis